MKSVRYHLPTASHDMFTGEIRIQPIFDPLSPGLREGLDRLDAHTKKIHAQHEAQSLVQSLRKDHTHRTKLTMTDGRTLKMAILDGARVEVKISQDHILPFHTISYVRWNFIAKTLLEYEEFDTQGLRVGSVRINPNWTLQNEPLYKAIDNREGRREPIDFTTGIQRRVYDEIASIFTVARTTLALDKTTHTLLPHRG